MKYSSKICFIIILSLYSPMIYSTPIKNSFSNDVEIKKSILYDISSSSFIISDDYDNPNYVAKAIYTETNLEKGTDTLSITTNKKFNDFLQAEAAGRIEGHLTRKAIYDHFRNLQSAGGELKKEEKQFLLDQENFIQRIYKEKPNDPNVFIGYLIYLQFKGLREEYNKNTTEVKPLKDEDFMYMAAFGDLFDIRSKYDGLDYSKLNKKELIDHFLRTNHCSAMFKMKEDFSDVLFAHNSWYFYSMMRRIMKEYNFNFNHPSVKAKNILFASYPSTLSSNDDFYITNKKLVIIETTNDILNKTLYDLLTPNTFLCYQRVMIANRMSSSAKEWGNNFIKYNSGTYNNMYMVLDLNKFNFNSNITMEKEALFITETIPGYTAINDVTTYLKYGYWPSYNIPFDPKIKSKSQLTKEFNKNIEGAEEWFDYDTCSRAKIFRRDHNTVNDLETMKKFIRKNNYKEDKLSGGPCAVISSRCELDTEEPRNMGAYDAKVGSAKEIINGFYGFHFISGPTTDGVPQFNTSDCPACGNSTYYGIKEIPNYEWVNFTARYEF